MPGTVSQIGFGISLAYSTTSGGSYAPLAELLSLTPPPEVADEIKVYRSDNSASVVERIPGWLEVGDAEAEITYKPAERALIESYLRVPGFWKVTYPMVAGQTAQGDVDAFAGFLKEIGKETPIKDAMKCKVKIAVNGGITYTQGS